MSSAPPPLVRPMRLPDVAVCERLSAESFLDVDLRAARPGDAVPQLRAPTRAESWVRRTEHLLHTDPGGCWVAEDPDGIAGFATSLTRELMWILSTYAVRPALQGRGTGKALLEAALGHGRGCLRGMLSSSSDPRAVRRYRLAGFSLHPQMHLTGTVDRAALPVVTGVREAAVGDLDLLDSVDRRTRGSAHGPDHALMARQWRAVVSDTTGGQGYAYVGPDGTPALLAATDRRTASRLLWSVLADGPVHTTVAHVTAANEWALDVGLAAGLAVHTEGYLAVRGMRPPAPYLHSGALL